MKRTITTLAILAVAATTAVAADLPSKNTPAAPAPIFTQSNYFVGVNVGADTATKQVFSGGISAGTNVLPYLAVEAAYDYGYAKDKVKGKHEKLNELTFNVLPQYKINGTDVTVYALAGVGYDWDSVKKNHSIYNVGGGLKYDFAKNIDLDLRYRYTNAIDDKFEGSDNRITVGLTYKF
jgi:opacity protein-like surface antigen